MYNASNPVPFALEPGRNCWRIERTGRASLVVDAADYFRLARNAMMKATKQIIIIGWDLDTRIQMHRGEAGDGAPGELGPFLSWLVRHRPELDVRILAWDGQAYKMLGRGTTLARIARWSFTERLQFRLDGKHPLKGCHHHKILVIDDCLAFCGGIDMTGSRWDTRDHADDEPGRKRPTTRRRYEPWHDATMAVDADAARALGDLARFRWNLACNDAVEPPGTTGDRWPDGLEAQFRDIDIGIARTRGRMEDIEEVREIERLYLDAIASAERYVYCEAQYFASRIIAEAIAKRLEEPLGPEFVIVNPRTAFGWLEEEAMGGARARLFRELDQRDRHNRLRIYSPVTEGGEDIYVHAKIMIVDDRLLRVGSANLNNRSMGLDSECDLLIDAGRDGQAASSERIAWIRCDLLAEHLGAKPQLVARTFGETQSLIATIERLRGEGRTLCPYEPPELDSFGKQLAESETMDPESADQPWEPFTRRRLLAGLRERG